MISSTVTDCQDCLTDLTVDMVEVGPFSWILLTAVLWSWQAAPRGGSTNMPWWSAIFPPTLLMIFTWALLVAAKADLSKTLKRFGLANGSIHGLHGSLDAMEKILAEAMIEEEELASQMDDDYALNKDAEGRRNRRGSMNFSDSPGNSPAMAGKSGGGPSPASGGEGARHAESLKRHSSSASRKGRVSMFVVRGAVEVGHATAKRRASQVQEPDDSDAGGLPSAQSAPALLDSSASLTSISEASGSPPSLDLNAAAAPAPTSPGGTVKLQPAPVGRHMHKIIKQKSLHAGHENEDTEISYEEGELQKDKIEWAPMFIKYAMDTLLILQSFGVALCK